MKNNKKMVVATLAGIAAIGLNSCGKYEDGPKFSLLTKKARLAGEWDVKSIGSETLDQDWALSLDFDKDGTVKYT